MSVSYYQSGYMMLIKGPPLFHKLTLVIPVTQSKLTFDSYIVVLSSHIPRIKSSEYNPILI